MMHNGLRGLLKTGIAVGAHWSRLDRVIASRRGLAHAPLVVGYHRVVKDFDHSARSSMASMLVSTATLRKQLEWIGQHYRFVSLDEYARLSADPEAQRHDSPQGKPVAVVTFDDGYRDVYENAFPLLQGMGIPFAVYVVTDMVGTDRLQLHDEIYLLVSAVLALHPAARSERWMTVAEGFGEGSARIAQLLREVDETGDPYRATRLLLHGLEVGELRSIVEQLEPLVELDEEQRNAFLSMDWAMLRELRDAGVSVGSHTRTHALLATSPEAVVREELEGSRRALEAQLEIPIRHLAYPDGSFNRDTIRAVRSAGYLTACTTAHQEDAEFPLLTIPRRGLWEQACTDSLGRFSPALLSCQINGVFDSGNSRGHEH